MRRLTSTTARLIYCGFLTVVFFLLDYRGGLGDRSLGEAAPLAAGVGAFILVSMELLEAVRRSLRKTQAHREG